MHALCDPCYACKDVQVLHCLITIEHDNHPSFLTQKRQPNYKADRRPQKIKTWSKSRPSINTAKEIGLHVLWLDTLFACKTIKLLKLAEPYKIINCYSKESWQVAKHLLQSCYLELRTGVQLEWNRCCSRVEQWWHDDCHLGAHHCHHSPHENIPVNHENQSITAV